jgi:hypothetical protein
MRASPPALPFRRGKLAELYHEAARKPSTPLHKQANVGS